MFHLAIVALTATALSSCTVSARKLDEAFIYEGPQFRVKLVRYYEDYPWHYTGETFKVQCASVNTKDSPNLRTQEAGWVTLGNGGAIGSKGATELAERERRNYLVVDNQTLVWLGMGVNVSFNACGYFRSWNPTSLPVDLIVPIKKPDYCAPKGTADCRYYDFMDDRQPKYESVRVSPNGNISFIVRSKAFKLNSAVRVQSMDFGKTWKIAVI